MKLHNREDFEVWKGCRGQPSIWLPVSCQGQMTERGIAYCRRWEEGQSRHIKERVENNKILYFSLQLAWRQRVHAVSWIQDWCNELHSYHWVQRRKTCKYALVSNKRHLIMRRKRSWGILGHMIWSSRVKPSSVSRRASVSSLMCREVRRAPLVASNGISRGTLLAQSWISISTVLEITLHKQERVLTRGLSRSNEWWIREFQAAGQSILKFDIERTCDDNSSDSVRVLHRSSSDEVVWTWQCVYMNGFAA